MLALPGSAYLYQGEELGLHQVADIPDQARQDPIFFRTAGAEKGRDGCRVPIPWTADGLSFGFGNNGAHLPQPAWFTAYSVQTEENELTSTLHLYRRALDLRHRLQAGEELEWVASDVQHLLHFVRPNGWQSVTNFGSELVTVPDGGSRDHELTPHRREASTGQHRVDHLMNTRDRAGSTSKMGAVVGGL